MTVIETMPAILGENIYPNGLPLMSSQITIVEITEPGAIYIPGETVQNIFLRYVDKQSQADERVLCDYVLYYLNAPCFIISDEIKSKAVDLSFDDLIDLCLDNGLDPF